MEFLNNPAVKTIFTLIGVCNAALITYPGTPEIVKTICGLVAVLLTGVFGITVKSVNNELKGARAENLALRIAKGSQP
jgi:ABC-type thiamin/hydroxymethylpyrimidine transport system permease subunit